jgi:DDE_Tnp_1-associated
MVPFAPLLSALAEIPDPRRPQGTRYPLAHLLLFAVLAVLAGATSYRGIVTFLAIHRARLGHVYGVRLRRAPAINTLRNLFLALDPAALEAAFRRHARHLGEAGRRRDGPGAVALDGKTLRRSFDRLHDRAAAHVLGAFAADAALILGHQEVPDAPTEVEGVRALIRDLGLTGVVLTVDALHCQNVWPAPSASGLSVRPWQSAPTYPASERCSRPRWRSARPGPHKTTGVEAPFFGPGFRPAGRLLGHLDPPPADISGRARPFRARGRSPWSCPCAGGRVEAPAGAQHRPGDPRQLVGQGDHHGVDVRAR